MDYIYPAAMADEDAVHPSFLRAGTTKPALPANDLFLRQQGAAARRDRWGAGCPFQF
jgi:hypothetical protein